jgi:hypothetical protein
MDIQPGPLQQPAVISAHRPGSNDCKTLHAAHRATPTRLSKAWKISARRMRRKTQILK